MRRSPFTGQLDYQDRKSELLKLSLAIATCAQRDRFAERPVEEIRTSCKELARLADSIIQDIMDPLILQPASLDLATLKKRAGDDLVSNVSTGWQYKRGNTVFHAIYLFMVLYNDSVSCTDCVASNGRPSSEQRIGRGAEGSCHDLISSSVSEFCRRECRKP